MPIAECIRPAEEWRSAMPVEYTAFFEVAGDIKIKAFERVDIDDQVEVEVRLCSEITILILRIKILMDCFHRSPRRAVSGPGSVAEQLKVTRNAVYKQIESFGLDITDFQVLTTLPQLIAKSGRAQEGIGRIRSLAKDKYRLVFPDLGF